MDGPVGHLDSWVCGGCRSVNARRVDRCYACRSPRAMGLEPAAAAVASPVASARDEPATPQDQRRLARLAGAAWGPTDRLAWMVRCVIMAVVVVTLAKLALDVRTLELYAGLAVDEGQLGVGLAPGPGTLVLIVAWMAAFVVWGAWLRQVVANLPAMGAGFPATSPAGAFLVSVIPGANLIWGTAVLRDVIVRLSPRGAARTGLLNAWWLAVLAALLPWVGRLPGEPGAIRALLRLASTALGGLFDGGAGRLAASQAGEVLAAILVVVAAALAIWLVDRVEDLQEVRWIQLRAGLDG